MKRGSVDTMCAADNLQRSRREGVHSGGLEPSGTEISEPFGELAEPPPALLRIVCTSGAIVVSGILNIH